MSYIGIQLVLYFLSFIAIWFGSGLIVNAVGALAKQLKLPQFTLSFFILGLLTSIPELVIGLVAIQNGEPEIFVGNLIGGVIVLFLCVIPLLSLFGKGIKAPKELSKQLLLLILIVSFTPSLLTGDKNVDNFEALLCLALYSLLIFFLPRKQGIVEKIKTSIAIHKPHLLFSLLKIGIGIVLVIISSDQIVNTTIYIADLFSINPFFISLIVVSLGTNIPEISLAIRSITNKNNDIALADYLGSATANTFLFGLLTLLYPTVVGIPNHFIHRSIFIVIGLICFYLFIRSKNTLSKKEACLLLILYSVFIITELLLVT